MLRRLRGSRSSRWRRHVHGWVVVATLCWPCWTATAASRRDQVEVLTPGSGPASVLRYRPVAESSQALAWEWTAMEIVDSGVTVRPVGNLRTAHGVLDARVETVEEEGFSCRRTLRVDGAEPADPAWSEGFRETVAEDSRGRMRSIESDGDLARPSGVVSPWTLHRALDIVFPEEPVGQEAQWKAVRSLELDDGLTVDVEAIYELKQVTPEMVGIVYSLEAKRTPAPAKYTREVQFSRRLDSDPSARARSRLFVSVTCNGRAFQDLSASLPGRAELQCQVVRHWKQGSTWTGLAAGEQVTVKVGPPGA